MTKPPKHADPARDPRIARLPIDDHTGLPIPVTAGLLPNGRPDFSMVYADKIVPIIQGRKCGVCGQPLGRWVAFIGGFHAARRGVFFDPPMHRTCAEAALVLCPHILLGRKVGTRFTTEGRVRPEGWYLYVTRGYGLTQASSFRQESTVAFAAHDPHELHRYHYVGDRLVYDRPCAQDELPTSHLPPA